MTDDANNTKSEPSGDQPTPAEHEEKSVQLSEQYEQRGLLVQPLNFEPVTDPEPGGPPPEADPPASATPAPESLPGAEGDDGS